MKKKLTKEEIAAKRHDIYMRNAEYNRAYAKERYYATREHRLEVMAAYRNRYKDASL